MSRRHLTTKQHAFYIYLRDYIRDNGVWPTYRTIQDEFGFRSPHSVTQNLVALAKKGFLVRDDDGYRLVKNGKGLYEASGIPVRGLITAGAPQDAHEVNLGELTLHSLFPHLDRVFALRVVGDSMSGAGIFDGDHVLLVEEQIPDGDVGAVLFNGETTLKYVHRTPAGGLRLEPANEAYQAIEILPGEFDEVRLVGRYIGRVNDDGILLKNGLPVLTPS